MSVSISAPADFTASLPTGLPPAAGIGLRAPHFDDILADAPDVAWMEFHPENFLSGGTPLHYLERIRARYPLSMHGVGLSLGSAEGLDGRHLRRLANLARHIEPAAVSEHVSWSAHAGTYLNDLLPLPYTEESLAVVCRNVEAAQEAFGCPILVENASTYLEFAHSTIPEWEFMRAIAARTGCGILLDVNNIYVSCRNHGWSADAYVDAMSDAPVGEIHLAGHARNDVHGRIVRIDDHGSRVDSAVWALYRQVLATVGRAPTLIEWDTNIPPLADLIDEAETAAAILAGDAAARSTTEIPTAEMRR